jgi:hypothetical protein
MVEVTKFIVDVDALNCTGAGITIGVTGLGGAGGK